MCKKINYFAPALFLFYLIASIVVGAGISLAGIHVPLWLSLVISQLFLLIPGIVYSKIMGIHLLTDLPYRKIRLHDAIDSVLIGYCMVPLILLINVISSLFATNYLNETQSELTTYPFIGQLLLMAVLPVIAEELLFRGLFYHSYRRNGILGAAILSGIIFGAIHLNINQFCYAVVMGTVFALMVEVTGSMFSSMLAHCAVNSYSIIMLKIVGLASTSYDNIENIQAESAAAMTPAVMAVQIVLLLVITCIFLVIARFLFRSMARRNNRLDYIENQIHKGLHAQNGERFITIPLAATLVAAAVFMILQEL